MPQLLCLAATRRCPNLAMIPSFLYSKGFVRVPHQVRKVARPMVSKALATTEIPTVSRARFSWNTWAMNCGSQDVSKEFALGRYCRYGTGRAYSRCRGGQEDEAAKVGRALVGQGSSRVDQGSNTIALQGGSDSLWRWSASRFYVKVAFLVAVLTVVPQATATLVASLDWMNCSLELARLALW